MTLSEELSARGFVNQTTYKDASALDGAPIMFYWGVDPSADSMTVGNLAIAMMIRHFMEHGHRAILLVGGATGLIGDPDGKAEEREQQSYAQIEHNKAAIVEQYRSLFAGLDFELVDNYDWFKDMGYLEFLRDVGKHFSMTELVQRDFIATRMGEGGAGISYAEFSYNLIQGYDYYWLHKNKGVVLQIGGSDQWGNMLSGAPLIRKKEGAEVHALSMPLIINKTTGKKFGKSEEGAVWLDPAKTTPTQFYQFWINVDDDGVSEYLKYYTVLSHEEIEQVVAEHHKNPATRLAQQRLAQEVTALVHGENDMHLAEQVTGYITGKSPIGDASDEALEALRKEIPSAKALDTAPLADVLATAGLVSSKSEARQLIGSGAVYINGASANKDTLELSDFQNGRLLLRKGKVLKNTALIERM